MVQLPRTTFLMFNCLRINWPLLCSPSPKKGVPYKMWPIWNTAAELLNKHFLLNSGHGCTLKDFWTKFKTPSKAIMEANQRVQKQAQYLIVEVIRHQKMPTAFGD